MKKKELTQQDLQEIIKKGVRMALFEAKDSTGAGDYAKKLDTFVSETVDKVSEMIKEGEEIILENPTHDYAIQERNHSVMSRIGILKALKGDLLRIMEDIHKNI